MIYSPDIEKKCALCLNAQIIKEDSKEFILCNLKNKTFSIDSEGCRKFDYDIFKRTVKRRKPLITDISPEDFSLEDNSENKNEDENTEPVK